jgi:hypothetical protein
MKMKKKEKGSLQVKRRELETDARSRRPKNR